MTFRIHGAAAVVLQEMDPTFGHGGEARRVWRAEVPRVGRAGKDNLGGPFRPPCVLVTLPVGFAVGAPSLKLSELSGECGANAERERNFHSPTMLSSLTARAAAGAGRAPCKRPCRPFTPEEQRANLHVCRHHDISGPPTSQEHTEHRIKEPDT